MSRTYRLATMKELKSRYGIPYCRQHIWRMINAGLFPRPVRLGQRRIAFICDQVEEWITKRAQASGVQLEPTF
jgi:prophage regulatory protein